MIEVGGNHNLSQAFEDFYTLKKAEPEEKKYTKKLVLSVYENLPRIDEIIKKHIENWRLERLSIVDKNILRIAIQEMISGDDIPMTVSINEAIEIAKKFGDTKSGMFVNGVLDSIKKDLRQRKGS